MFICPYTRRTLDPRAPFAKNLKYPTNLNNCVIKHKLRTFSKTSLNMRGNHFLVNGAEKELLCNCYRFKYVVIIVKETDIQHDISSPRLLSELYFR